MGERQQRAFEKLKERFTTEPVLVTPDLDKEMRVEADVSDIGGRDGIVEEPSVHVYYAYFKPT